MSDRGSGDPASLDRLRALDDLLGSVGVQTPPSLPRGQPIVPPVTARAAPTAGSPTLTPRPAETLRPRARPPRPRREAPARSARATPTTRVAPAMGYQPALDGLRALSVIAVIFYHGGFTWMTGGFFGVEVFFVVSGFLITSLLLDERERSPGRRPPIDLGQFWLRRARRLLPALGVMLAAIATWTMLVGTAEQRSQLRRDLPWSIFYVGNWGQILGDVPYYTGDPPLLRHLWSLAVEEQWYLLWPLAFVAITALGLRDAAAGRLLAGSSFAAMVLMFWIHRGGPGPIGSPFGMFDGVDRLNFNYLATFTRSSGLLLGAAAAFVWRPWRTVTDTAERPAANRPVLDAAGAAAVAGLGVIAASAVLVEGYVFQWLMAMVTILSTVAVMAAVHPGATWYRKALGWRPLVEVGKRSYGLYLWHWPIFVFCGATHGSVQRVAGALMLTVAVSELCYQFVETPVRRGALGRWWRTAGPAGRRKPLVAAGVLVAVLAGFYVTVRPYDRAAGGDAGVFTAPSPTAPSPALSPTTLPAAGATTLPAAAAGQPSAASAAPAAPAPTATVPRAAGPVRLVIVGDSTGHALAINEPDGIDDTFTVSDGSVSGCSVYEGGRVFSTRQGFSNNFAMCEGWADDWAEAARDADAEVALVVLGAWDVFDLESDDGGRLTFGTAEWDAYVRDGLQRGIDALVGAGARVALLEVPCMRPQDVEGAGVPALPERGDDARVAHLNDLWRQVAAANAGTVTFVAGPTEWCADESIATDLGYRWDGVHVYGPGAALIFETIAPALLALV